MGFRYRKIRYRNIRVHILTLFISATGIFIIVNMTALSLDMNQSSRDSTEHAEPWELDEFGKDVFLHEFNILNDQNVAKGMRKPKTTNIENNIDNPAQIGESEKDHELFVQKYDNSYNGNDANYMGASEGNNNNNPVKAEDDIQQGDSPNDGDVSEYTNDEDEQFDDFEEAEEDKEDDDNVESNTPTVYNPNQPFKPGDFGDITGLEYQQKPSLTLTKAGNNNMNDIKQAKSLHFKDSATKNAKITAKLREILKENSKGEKKSQQNVIQMEKQSRNVPDLVQDRIYWSSYVESLIPKGLSFTNVTKLVRTLRSSVVQRLEKPQWNRCGRPKNGYVILENGQQMCARHRETNSVFIYGEVLSFYLSRMLGMDNVPVVVLSNTNATQWQSVNIKHLQWQDNLPIALIEWIPDLDLRGSRVYIPPPLLQAYKTGYPMTFKDVAKLHLLSEGNRTAQLSALVQWSTMIVFDYITGNYDRVASMQDGAAGQKKESVIEESIRNLRQTAKTGKFWLFDNESGLFDGYNTLSVNPNKRLTKFTNFHNKMLHTTCVFQRSLVSELRKLSQHEAPHMRLVHFAESYEPLVHSLDMTQNYFKRFETMFKMRLKEVILWVEHCDMLNTSPS